MSGTNGHNTEAALELSQPVNLDVINTITTNKYIGASTLDISPEATTILQEPVKDEEVSIRPDGLIYLPQVFVRDRLNRAVGIGKWVLVEEFAKVVDDTMMYKGSLYIHGCYVATAIGEMEYHQNNSMQSWASVYEGAKSDCLSRCGKDLGIGKECWMPSYSSEWVQKYAVKVWREKAKKGAGEFQWRHKDSMPFWDEKGTAPDSPNQPAFSKNKPKADKKDDVGTAFKPLTDAALKKQLKDTNSLNDLRILFDRVSKTNAKQAEKFKGEFTKKKEVIKKAIEAKRESSSNTSDVVTAVIDALTPEMFDRGDWKSLEKLIDEVKDSDKKREYLERYKKHLSDIGKGDHEIDIIPF